MNFDLARTVLVVVDMQNGFVRSRSRHIVPTVVDLVTRWQATGGATVFTRYLNYPGSPYERLIGWSRMMEAPETDIIDELGPAVGANPVIDKHIYSPFTAYGVHVFERGGWMDLLICGIATESCVLKTAVDAFERGLTPWVLTDAIASHAGPEAHQAGLVVLGRFIGRDQLIARCDIAFDGIYSGSLKAEKPCSS